MRDMCTASGLRVTPDCSAATVTLVEALDILKRSPVANRKLCEVSEAEFVESFCSAYEQDCTARTTFVQELPPSLLPRCDRPAEQVCAVTNANGMRMYIPDRFYERGWGKHDCAFYFPLASEYNRVTLKELLRILCNREQDYDTLCTKNKFRSGCLLTTGDGFTAEQLEQFRKAARIILYGFGKHRNALTCPLDSIGSAVAVYINHTMVLRRVLEAYYGQAAWDDEYRSSGDALREFDLRLAKSDPLTVYPALQRLASTDNVWVPVLKKGVRE